jgi:adenine-specific DNA-methyltransferase
MMVLSQKHRGAYFTPHPVASALVRWAVNDPTDRMLAPSCGDGRFLVGHRNSVGIEVRAFGCGCHGRAPWALIHEGDFLN